MYIGLHANHTLFLSDLNQTWIFSTDFEKYSNIKFRENPSSVTRFDPRRRTDLRKLLTVAFRNFANAPKNEYECLP